MSGIEGKYIVLGVCGGIAAYKAAELVRLLTKQEALVKVVMTKNAEKFVGPATFEALTHQTVCSDLFDRTDEAAISHIEWAQQADAVVIAPATANIIGKMAGGIADDALSTFLLAVTAPVIVCPAMNTHMYESRAVQRNLKILKDDGYLILDPGQGELACGTVGPGRLPDPEQIFDRLVSALTIKDFKGMHVLVTAGPTQEAIDPVRFISNPSTGKMGYALAKAAEHRGAHVTLVSGPTDLLPPLNVEVIQIQNTKEMAHAVMQRFDQVQVVIKAAAVSDYRPSLVVKHKIKKTDDPIHLEMIRNPDILKEIGRRKSKQILVGFAAETQQLEENAATKLKSKNLDMIVGNLIGPMDSGFKADTNRVALFHKDGTKEALPVMDKFAVANGILDRILAISKKRTL
ncbi:MAG: bifunctional phosphopantothenoylcysteine decarboxylase/phosphopantothenate--cysteine ligase CoaBC [Desulfobacteraceae bacterium]|jgi:phosphopantothenoylcysteine decarboxylase/phosphopantothenate--cysteine ligase